MIDVLTPLVVNLATRNRDYAFFVGAGFSKDAGIKSGWDILIETLKPLYLKEIAPKELGPDYAKQIEAWYLQHKKYSKLDYSQLLAALYKGDIERREYLKSFFTDTVPGEAHNNLADLVKHGFVRFIFTTNFDNLIEKALDNTGVEYDVILNDEMLNESMSWDRVKHCRVYKLHGDYRVGRLRNTPSELVSLDPGIAGDFQYIIDRHGLVVIGYSGRDEGIMKHFTARSPYRYPFYWQLQTMLPKTVEYARFHSVLDLYATTHKREIQVVERHSAGGLLGEIIAGMENLNRFLIVNENDRARYRSHIINSDSKKIRALSLELLNKYFDLYSEYAAREDTSRYFQHKYETYTSLLRILPAFHVYLEELLQYNESAEAEYLFLRLFEPGRNATQGISEFVRRSVLYYLFMTCGAMLLKHQRIDILSAIYGLNVRNEYGNQENLMEEISRPGDGWEYVVKEIHKQDYYAKKYAVLLDYCLPAGITKQEIHNFDTFVTLEIAVRDLPIFWFAGASAYYSAFAAAYRVVFEERVTDRGTAIRLLAGLRSKYGRYGHGLVEGINMVFRSVSEKYNITDEDLKPASH